MIKYCIMSQYSNCSKSEALDFLKGSDKPVLFTYGLRFKSPTTKDVPMSKEDAIKKFTESSMCDLTEYEDYIDLNMYGGNDLW